MKIYRKSVWQMTADGMELIPHECESFEYAGPIAECKKGGKAPPPPDPYATAAAQTQANRETTAYNNAIQHGNVTTPYGNQTFTGRVDPTTGAMVYDQTISVSPEVQELLEMYQQQDLALGNTSQKMLDTVDSTYSNPLDTSNIPAMTGSLDTSSLPKLYGADDLEGARQAVSDALYKRQTAYLDPQYQQREQALESQLSNMGITRGSEAWNNELDRFSKERSFNYDQARTSSIAGGLSELTGLASLAQSNRAQTFGEQTTAGNFANNARAQALQELLTRRNQPLNEYNALRSATQVNVPQFQNPQNAQSQATDVAGNIWNAYNGELNAWNAQQQSNNSFLSGLMGLGGTLGAAKIMGPMAVASDRRVKSNVKRIGLLPQGIGVYEYEYTGDPLREKQTGVMAQEVEQYDPGAVITDDDGVKRVNYTRVLAKALEERLDAAA